jgi:hypothetical protein
MRIIADFTDFTDPNCFTDPNYFMAAGGNGPLAANIIVVSTALLIVSITLGLSLLQFYGWV